MLSINSGIAQSSRKMNILDCMELIDFDIHKYVQADVVFERTQKVINLKSGYYEVNIDQSEEIKLCQVAKFNNSDGTVLLGISGFYGDEQCSNHPFFFYEISKSGDSFTSLEHKAILPTIDFSMFFKDSKPIETLEKYLPEIKERYLDASATIEDLLKEIYQIHILLPQKGTSIKATLSICDYIPRNEVHINQGDWNIIERSIVEVELKYNKRQKQFLKN